jgi:hypothetical protein
VEAREALEYQWPYLLTLLPPLEELEASAYDTSALSRRRCVDSASTLLRLVLAYGFCGFSLRQTAAWAETAGVASLSDVALLKRFRASHAWLGQLLAGKLAERAAFPSLSLRLRLFDATTVSRPGSTGTDWRLHLSFDLARMTVDHFQLSDHTLGESLSNFLLTPGEVAVADAGYSHRAGLWHVHRSGAAFLVRINWQNTPLQHRDGSPFDILQMLRSLPDAAPFSCPVHIAADRSRQIPALAARFVAVRKSEEAAAAARQRVLHERSRKGGKVDPRTLEAAGYIFVLTSLAESFTAEQILDLYRFRWQVELAFKRLKSILHFDQLPAKDPDLARTVLYAKLLAALLLEDYTTKFLAIFPWGYPLRAS